MLKKTKKSMTLIEESTRNENGRMERNETKIRECVETEITDKERLITDELKGLMINKDQKSRSKEIERCN